MAEPKEQVTFVVNIHNNNVEILEDGYVDVNYYIAQMTRLGWQVERKENKLYLSKSLEEFTEPSIRDFESKKSKRIFPLTKE